MVWINLGKTEVKHQIWAWVPLLWNLQILMPSHWAQQTLMSVVFIVFRVGKEKQASSGRLELVTAWTVVQAVKVSGVRKRFYCFENQNESNISSAMFHRRVSQDCGGWGAGVILNCFIRRLENLNPSPISSFWLWILTSFCNILLLFWATGGCPPMDRKH